MASNLSIFLTSFSKEELLAEDEDGDLVEFLLRKSLLEKRDIGRLISSNSYQTATSTNKRAKFKRFFYS